MYDYTILNTVQVNSDNNFLYLRAQRQFNDGFQIVDKVLLINPQSPTVSLLAYSLTLDTEAYGEAFIFDSKLNVSAVLYLSNGALNLLLANNKLRIYSDINIK